MKKVISLILVMTILFSITGCVNVEYAEADTETGYIQDGNSGCYIYVDKETGVNYMIYSCGRKGGITVRLNADGTPYVSGVNGNE